MISSHARFENLIAYEFGTTRTSRPLRFEPMQATSVTFRSGCSGSNSESSDSNVSPQITHSTVTFIVINPTSVASYSMTCRLPNRRNLRQFDDQSETIYTEPRFNAMYSATRRQLIPSPDAIVFTVKMTL